jgi:hypothetical protein
MSMSYNVHVFNSNTTGVNCGAGTPNLHECLRSLPVFSGVRVAAQSLVFCVMFYRMLFVFCSWPLYCLSFDLQLLITPLYLQNFLFLSNIALLTITAIKILYICGMVLNIMIKNDCFYF